jgi:predicted cytidylate kinase
LSSYNISFAGLHGTGKSTIAQRIAKHFNFEFYSSGMAFRESAKEHGMNLEKFSKYVENHPEIDEEIDEKVLSLARKEGNHVFEGQLPSYILGDLLDFGILLRCEEATRVSRMSKRDKEHIEAKIKETKLREQSEWERFLNLYEIDVRDPHLQLSTFHLIIDTTDLSIDAVFQICVKALEEIIPPH